MPRYPKQDDPKGKKIIPSVTEIISDCTNSSGALTQWAANMVVEWIREKCDNAKIWDGVAEETYYRVFESHLNDARFNFRKVSQKALDIGSEVHNAIEMHLSKKPYKIPSSGEIFEAFNAFREWESEHNLKPIALEQTVYGDGFAGTLDFYGYFNDKLYVIDWKSSKAHYPEMRYQVAAYRYSMNNLIIRDCFEESKKTPDPIKYMHKLEDINEIKGCGVLRLDKETGLPDWKDTSGTYESDLEIFNAMVDLYFKRHPKIAKKARG